MASSSQGIAPHSAQLALARPVREDEIRSVEFMLADLARSGLVPEDMGAYPIGLQAMQTTPAYVIPYHDPRMYRIRYDRAVDKYTQPPRIRDVWWSPQQDIKSFSSAPVLYIIEGEKKAAAFVKKWPSLPAFGIGGAHMAVERVPGSGTFKLLDNILRHVTPGQRVIAIFDGDILTKVGIQQAAHTLKLVVETMGCTYEVFRPPLGKGVDDWLVDDPEAELTNLAPVSVEDLAISRKNLYTKLGLLFSDKGQLLANEVNIKDLLGAYFAGRVFNDKRYGIVKDREAVDQLTLVTESLEYIQRNHLYKASLGIIEKCMHLTLHENRTDMVRDFVLKLVWDGVPRLETWGSEYLKTSIPAQADDWGRLLMTGMTLRILEPGTKFDLVPILVGAQGIGKTTFFEDISMFGGRKFYHSCTELGTDGDVSRTQVISFIQSLIVDLGEGVVFESKKALMDRAKQRISQTYDEYRPLYSSHIVREPRGFIFTGTSNRFDQLNDPTGSRRYLPMEVLHITRLPYETKLQIMAEIVAKEAAIRDSAWYESRLKLEDVPQSIREEHQHITSAQELINTGFSKFNAHEDFILKLLEGGVAARLRDTDKLYITAGYVAYRLNDGRIDMSQRNLIARVLSGLSHSPAFPWTLTNQRKRLPQLAIPKDMELGYTDGISNNQQMINGYIAVRK